MARTYHGDTEMIGETLAFLHRHNRFALLCAAALPMLFVIPLW
jgi:hypothetical protein